MNAGKNYEKAKAQARANANRADEPRWLHWYGGAWWISKTPTASGEKINPGHSSKSRHHATRRSTKRPREITKENVVALQARGRKAAADGLLGFELDNQLKAERLSPAEHRIVRSAFNIALVAGDDEPTPINHSTKKSPAQLDREIAAALKKTNRSCCDGRRSGHASHATMKSAVPGIAKWNTFAGGTGAAEGKHSYSYKAGIKGEYHIWPYTTRHGRHAGYALKYAATGGQPRGSHGGLWHELGTYSSSASAAKAAREHYQRSFQ